MIRSIALSVLVAVSLSIVAPALAPTPVYAADSTMVQGGLPPVPWAKIAQWALKNALTLLMLAEEIWRDVTGSGRNPPPEQPPPTSPPPSQLPEEGIAFARPPFAGVFA